MPEAIRTPRGTCVALGARMHECGHPVNLEGQTLAVILNPDAGSDPKARIAEITGVLEAAHVRPDVYLVKPDRLADTIKQLIDAGATAIAVGGGDGTISSAVHALAGTEVVLIPLPLGTLNHFATRYGIGTLEAAALAFADGCVVKIPVGTVNGRPFVNNASCGFYPHVVRHRERLRPALSKWTAAALASVLVTVKRPLIELELEVRGQRLHRQTAALWVGIGRNSLRLPEIGDAEKEGDVLEIVLPRPHSRLKLFFLAVRTFKRLKQSKKALDPELELLRSSDFTLRSHRPIDVAMDGEIHVMAGPIHFRHQPHAVSVLSMVVPSEG